MLLLGLGVAGFLIGVARLALVWYGQAKATAVEKWLGAQAAKFQVVLAGYLRRKKEIEQQPDKHGDDLTDALNQEFKDKE